MVFWTPNLHPATDAIYFLAILICWSLSPIQTNSGIPFTREGVMAPSCFIEPPVCRLYNINQRGKSSYAANPHAILAGHLPTSPRSRPKDRFASWKCPLQLHRLYQRCSSNFSEKLPHSSNLWPIIILFKEQEDERPPVNSPSLWRVERIPTYWAETKGFLFYVVVTVFAFY